jgi:protein-tyrosine-phosphatase
MTEILIVCTANRGRSPISEAILRRLLEERGITDVRVSSAGLSAYELDRAGLPADPRSAAVCDRHGLDLSGHVSRPVTPELIESVDLVVVMELWQADAMGHAYPDANVHTLPEIGGEERADVADIAGLPEEGIDAFRARAEALLRAGLARGPLADVVGRAAAA